MPTSRNSKGDRLPDSTGTNPNPNDTAKQNYTGLRYGNDHGSISFGHIHQTADVTAAVKLETPDGRHTFFLDEDGQRKGWTTSLSPGNFQVECGSDNVEADDTCMINAKNGNIDIIATNGKIRLQATDIEIIAVGEGGSKGNIIMEATENVAVRNCKKFLVNASVNYKLATSGLGEITSNSRLKIYGSIIQGVTDACAKKDSKNGGQRYQRQNNQV